MNRVATITIPKINLKVLTELTGEPRFEVALSMTLRDALEYRLEKVKNGLKTYEERYKMPFRNFEKLWEKEKIPKQYSYKKEKDFLEWEGMVSRKNKIEKILRWFPE
jgi:hypothetical protein